MTTPDGWQIEHEGHGRFLVKRRGGGGPYLVDLLEPDGPRCSCPHDEIKLHPRREEGGNPRPCVHVERLIFWLGERVVEAMRRESADSKTPPVAIFRAADGV